MSRAVSIFRYKWLSGFSLSFALFEHMYGTHIQANFYLFGFSCVRLFHSSNTKQNYKSMARFVRSFCFMCDLGYPIELVRFAFLEHTRKVLVLEFGEYVDEKCFCYVSLSLSLCMAQSKITNIEDNSNLVYH